MYPIKINGITYNLLKLSYADYKALTGGYKKDYYNLFKQNGLPVPEPESEPEKKKGKGDK